MCSALCVPLLHLEAFGRVRVSFGASLSISEYDGKQVPGPGSFRPVKAEDLSQTGISFFTTQWPSSSLLMLCFGGGDGPVQVTARVVSSRQMPAEDGTQYEVRCEFVEWLNA